MGYKGIRLESEGLRSTGSIGLGGLVVQNASGA